MDVNKKIAMKKRRTLTFLIAILLLLPLLQVVTVLMVGEVYLRWTVVILSVLFYLLLATNYVFWHHLNRKIDVYFGRLIRRLESYSGSLSLPQDTQTVADIMQIKEVAGNEELRKSLQEAYPAFLLRLHEHCPGLTESDEFLCMLIKLNLSNKEVTQRLSISQGSLHTTRYRLKRKLSIPKEDNLDDWIQRLE